DWPIAYRSKGSIKLRNRRLQAIIDESELSHEKITKVNVIIPDLFDGDQQVLVQGKMPVALKNISSFIRHSPLKSDLSSLAKMEFLGHGELDIDIHIPLVQSS